MVYDVENVLTHVVERVHAARPLLYGAELDGKMLSEDLMKHIEHSEATYELVDQLTDISGIRKDGIFVQVQWLGLLDKKDWTWQKLEEQHEDVPDRVEEFLKSSGKKTVVKEAKQVLVFVNVMARICQEQSRHGAIWTTCAAESKVCRQPRKHWRVMLKLFTGGEGY